MINVGKCLKWRWLSFVSIVALSPHSFMFSCFLVSFFQYLRFFLPLVVMTPPTGLWPFQLGISSPSFTFTLRRAIFSTIIVVIAWHTIRGMHLYHRSMFIPVVVDGDDDENDYYGFHGDTAVGCCCVHFSNVFPLLYIGLLSVIGRLFWPMKWM